MRHLVRLSLLWISCGHRSLFCLDVPQLILGFDHHIDSLVWDPKSYGTGFLLRNSGLTCFYPFYPSLLIFSCQEGPFLNQQENFLKLYSPPSFALCVKLYNDSSKHWLNSFQFKSWRRSDSQWVSMRSKGQAQSFSVMTIQEFRQEDFTTVLSPPEVIW